MLIPCPHCGRRDHAEFSYCGDASLQRPDDAAPFSAWEDYVHLRLNPNGQHRELWQHIFGCRSFLVVERDTRTHEIFASWLAGTSRLES